MSDYKEYIECPLCGKQYQELGWRHLKYSHSLTKEQFLSKFPGFQFRSDKLKDKVKKINQEIGNRESVKEKRSKKMKYNYENTDLKEVLREKTFKLWETDEYRQKVVNAQIESHKDTEVRRKISEANIEKWSDPEYHERVSEKIRKTQNREDKKKVMRKKSQENWLDAEFILKQSLGSSKHKHYIGGVERPLRSSWEKTVCSYLDRMGLEYEYEKYQFRYTSSKGIDRIYVPDFYIRDLDLFLEVKPLFRIEKYPDVKLKERAVLESGNNIEFVTDKYVEDYDMFKSLVDNCSSTAIPDMGVGSK